MMTAREERLRQLCELVETLYHDVQRHITESNDRDDPFTRRGFVRCICAYIEGVTFLMKQAALLEQEFHGLPIFTTAEVMLLSDLTPELSDNGKSSERLAKLRTLPNIRFALVSFARAHRAELDVSFSGAEWRQVREAFRVRDNLMHPKHSADLDVSSDEAAAALRAGRWFHDTYLSILKQTPARKRAQRVAEPFASPAVGILASAAGSAQ